MKRSAYGCALDDLAKRGAAGGGVMAEAAGEAAGKPVRVYSRGCLQRRLAGVPRALTLGLHRCGRSRSCHARVVGSSRSCSLAWQWLARNLDMTDCVCQGAWKCDIV